MKTKAILVMMFVVAGFVVPGLADFRTVGVYDPTSGPANEPWQNDVDQAGVYSSGTGGANASNVILWAEYTSTFKAEIAAAWAANMGGVVDCEGGPNSRELDADGDLNVIRAIYGTGGGKTLDITNTEGLITFGTGRQERQPISGNHRFGKSGSSTFAYAIGDITGGLPGERVIKFGGTMIERNDRSMAFTVVAYFSDGSTVTATAGTTATGEGTDSDQDTFFGFVAPTDEYITRVDFQTDWTHMDDLFFITSDDFPPASDAGDNQTVQLHDTSGAGIVMVGDVSNAAVEDYTYAWTCVPDVNVVITNADDQNPTITFQDLGVYAVTLNVNGSINEDLEPDTITITVVDSVSNAGPDQTVQKYDVITMSGGVDLAGSVDNPYDGLEGAETNYTYAWTGGFTTGGGSTTGATPHVDFPDATGDYELTLVVTGNDVQGELASDTVIISVVEPLADAGADITVALSVAETSGVKMDAGVNDPIDGESYTYEWTCPTGGVAYDPNQYVLNPTVTFDSKVDYVLTLTVTGSAPWNSGSTDDVTIRVGNNPALVAHFAIDAGEWAAGEYLDSSTEGDPNTNNNHSYITVSMGEVKELSDVSNTDDDSEDGPVGCDQFGAIDMDFGNSDPDPNGVILYLDRSEPNGFNDDEAHLDNIRDAVTVALWVNLDSVSRNHCLIDKAGSFRFSVDDSGYLKTKLWLSDDSTPQVNSEDGDLGDDLDDDHLAIDDNEWHHIAFTYDAADRMVYQFIDGAEVRSKGIGAGLSLKMNANSLYLGMEDDGDNKTDGEFDDIRIYNYALAPYEIVELASMGESSALIYAGSDKTINPNTLPYKLRGRYIQLGQGTDRVSPEPKESRRDPGEYFFGWEQTGGPELSGTDPNQYQAIFSDAGDPEANVTFVEPGDYTLRFTARERYCGSTIRVSDSMTITIDAPTDALGSMLLGGANNAANIAGNDSVVSLPDLAALAENWGSSAP